MLTAAKSQPQTLCATSQLSGLLLSMSPRRLWLTASAIGARRKRRSKSCCASSIVICYERRRGNVTITVYHHLQTASEVGGSAGGACGLSEATGPVVASLG